MSAYGNSYQDRSGAESVAVTSVRATFAVVFVLGPAMLLGEDFRKSYFALTWSPAGDRLATGDYAGRVRVYDPALRAAPKLLVKHKRFVTALDYSPDGKLIASGDVDGVIQLTELATGRTVATKDFAMERLTVHRLKFAADGKKLILGVFGQPENSILIWDVGAWRESKRIPIPYLQSLDVSPKGDLVAAVGAAEVVLLTVAGEIHRRVRCQGVLSVAFSPKGDVLYSAGNGIQSWDMVSGRLLREVKAEFGVAAITIVPDGKALYWSGGSAVYQYDASSGESTVLVGGLETLARNLAVNPKGSLLAGALDDCTLRVWDVGAKRELGKAHAE